jgi:hypothetical protein
MKSKNKAKRDKVRECKLKQDRERYNKESIFETSLMFGSEKNSGRKNAKTKRRGAKMWKNKFSKMSEFRAFSCKSVKVCPLSF